MADHVCPPWIGYFLINPLRKLLENPNKILGPFVQEGMTVLEPGCGMGYFTLPLARMVGPAGRILAVDIQPKMLSVLERRAGKAGLLNIIEPRRPDGGGLGIEDFANRVDFAAALYVVHEVPDQAVFYSEVWAALKPGGRLLVVEPKGHVSREKFEKSITVAEEIGFQNEPLSHKVGGRGALLTKPGV